MVFLPLSSCTVLRGYRNIAHLDSSHSITTSGEKEERGLVIRWTSSWLSAGRKPNSCISGDGVGVESTVLSERSHRERTNAACFSLLLEAQKGRLRK